MHRSAVVLYLSLIVIVLFLWTSIAWMAIKWVMIIMLLLFVVFVVLWATIGNNCFMWPVSFQTVPGFQRIIQDDLTVMDSHTPSSKLIVLLPGTCAPWGPHRDKHRSQWAHRMLTLTSKGYRVFLVQHRFGWRANNLKQRVADLNCVMRWIQINRPNVSTIVLGDGYGATVALKWASIHYTIGTFPILKGIVCTESRVTFYNGLKRLLLPEWMYGTNDTDLFEDADKTFTSHTNTEINNQYNDDDNLFHILSRVVRKIPLVFVYARDDVHSDKNVWEKFLSRYQGEMCDTHDKPAVWGCRVRNRPLHAYQDIPIMDRHEWIPLLHVMIT